MTLGSMHTEEQYGIRFGSEDHSLKRVWTSESHPCGVR